MSIKPNRHPPPGSAGNTQGLIVPQTAPHASGAGNPAPEPRAEAETQGWWKRWGSDVAHGALDVVGLIPVLGEAADGLNAVIYVAEGDYVNAALSAAAMLPVGGQAATAAKFGKKAAEAGIDASRQAAKQAGKQAGKEAAEEGAGQTAKKAGAGGGGKRNDGGYVEGKKKPGPCDHLKKGSGKGPYRGGAHGETKKPTNDGLDSHHMPADSATSLKKNDGPAIKMDPADHYKTSSNGKTRGHDAYIESITDLLSSGKWRDALAKEIKDVRRVSGKKYNEGIKEMLEYAKCLGKHGLLK